MPELARFLGIVITMFFFDHNPPHIHAFGGNRKRPDWAAQISIRDGVILEGEVPSLAARLIREWIQLHRDELLSAWDRAVVGKEPGKVAPLRFR